MFIAIKPCAFARNSFRVGDTIPDELILPEAISRLKKSGVIAEVAPESSFPVSTSIDTNTIGVPVIKDGEIILTALSVENISTWATVLQKSISEATDIIQTITEENLLMVIHATDSRKGIKTAVETKATELNIIDEPQEEEVKEPEETTPNGDEKEKPEE